MILLRLKTETRDSHLRVERDLGVMNPDLNLPEYRTLVSRLYAFHLWWEPLVSLLLNDEAFFGPRRKLGLLKRDLEILGAPLPGRPARSGLALRTAQDALGSLYVLEGSTLGGQLIAQHVEAALGLAHGEGSAYFRSYGKTVAERWREFQARLLAMSSPGADDAMVVAASATFDHLHDWLCPVSTVPWVRRYG